MEKKECKALLGSLSDYVDGTAEAELCRELERHLAECIHSYFHQRLIRNQRRCSGPVLALVLNRHRGVNRIASKQIVEGVAKPQR